MNMKQKERWLDGINVGQALRKSFLRGSLPDIKSQAHFALARFGAFLMAELRAYAVRIPPHFGVYVCEGVLVRTPGYHPQSEKIDLLLASRPEWLIRIKELEVLFELARRLEKPNDPLPDSVHFCVGFTAGGCVAFFSDITKE